MIGFPLKIYVVENLTDFLDLPSAEGFAQALTSNKRAPDSVREGAHGLPKSARSMPANVRAVLKRREGRSKAKLNI
jgi:hypothetical protein